MCTFENDFGMMSSLNLYSTTQDEKHSTRLLLEVSSLFFFFSSFVSTGRISRRWMWASTPPASSQSPRRSPLGGIHRVGASIMKKCNIQHSHSSLVSRPSFALDCVSGWLAGAFVSLCIFDFSACFCLFWSLSHRSFVTLDRCPFLLCR